jgi:hypothetical protein
MRERSIHVAECQAEMSKRPRTARPLPFLP